MSSLVTPPAEVEWLIRTLEADFSTMRDAHVGNWPDSMVGTEFEDIQIRIADSVAWLIYFAEHHSVDSSPLILFKRDWNLAWSTTVRPLDVVAKIDAVNLDSFMATVHRIQTKARLLTEEESNRGEGAQRRTETDLTKAQIERLVRKHIEAKRAAGTELREITRDRVAEATNVSKGMVSGTDAWKELATEKRQENLPPSAPLSSVESEIDAAIERCDWEAAKSLQEQEQRQKPRKHF